MVVPLLKRTQSDNQVCISSAIMPRSHDQIVGDQCRFLNRRYTKGVPEASWLRMSARWGVMSRSLLWPPPCLPVAAYALLRLLSLLRASPSVVVTACFSVCLRVCAMRCALLLPLSGLRAVCALLRLLASPPRCCGCCEGPLPPCQTQS